ncbi:DNA replication licensing factor MCM3 isoform X2 [Triticum aestivum]|uniref:DNA replication licensing factor MCM3 isoform X2 n=1 Tax=Triticum aestivum TaxID=4565 RepID=UPI001D022BF6|nr:DNA replication licensing factor MCM3-like isoform X2 [Triticum aestivum]XP_044325607.1 DNA replication licensing factor MCM3-like isoform X2 [Triticum aestivum]
MGPLLRCAHNLMPHTIFRASDHIATTYAELRDGTANAKVLKTDVEAALQVLIFAIFRKELTGMEDREQRETEKQQAEQDAGAGGDNVDRPGGASGGYADGYGRSGNDPMDVDVGSGNASNDQDVSSENGSI